MESLSQRQGKGCFSLCAKLGFGLLRWDPRMEFPSLVAAQIASPAM